ncbi:hypothetical protein OKW43_006822 [Paraburkholderia sp. WC7.3g]|uniref:Uncharacterized protein n=1 Tax=Paraburkholderia podalyriae TaxID=1938811 RepID=A0ABR7PMC3_9BURK|nr:hypothetical protein [Paraburkholderia podalyriae]MBC8747452.1 hypothetical protein [Paraburkholderia podalyriae]
METKRSELDVSTSSTTVVGLIELATHAIDLLARDQIDPRFARKLWKRMSNEAECIEQQSGELTSTLEKTLEQLEHAVTDHQADDLVHAAAALREETGIKEKKAKNKK